MTDPTVIKGAFGADKPLSPMDEAAHANTIKFLEDTLTRAKREKATCALVIMTMPEGSVLDGWSEGAARAYTMLGALTDVTMKWRDKNIEQR